jgi:hypothetical protein
LFQNLTCGSQWLGKDRRFVWNVVWHGVQILRGEAEILRHHPIAPADPKRSAIGAVSWPPGTTGGTCSTGSIDLAHDALTMPGGVLRLLDHTYELVAQDAMKACISPHNLEVRVADTGQDRPDLYLTRSGL